ncbi:MAG: chorismate-binding protein [Ignavibacteriales bacterium]|nr:chorismate-binding protein [Ignavibacteriales bacterium]
MRTIFTNSKKNINEQQSVVNFITNLIKNISDEIYFDEKPIIRKLPNIQHLWTLIKAKMNKNYKIFDVLLKLHPTPAICGTPWNVAQKYILDVEEHDRGLYSGNIGWFNYNGSGEFAVGIRSALIKDTQLYAYSGCGIVEGSEPQSEFEESEIKLKPILSLFVDEKIYQS